MTVFIIMIIVVILVIVMLHSPQPVISYSSYLYLFLILNSTQFMNCPLWLNLVTNSANTESCDDDLLCFLMSLLLNKVQFMLTTNHIECISQPHMHTYAVSLKL